MNNQNNPDDARELIHRELNKKKKQELKDNHDMVLFESAELPAHIEGQFLDYITEFERQWEGSGQVPVREYIGNPTLPPIAALSSQEITRELDKILRLMSDHHVQIDFLTDVSEAEKYRFISEELLDEEMNNVRIPGMSMNFIYEEFYPELTDWDKLGDEQEDEE